MLCKYRNIFGEPNKGFHQMRIFSMALNDWLGTFVLAYLFGRCFGYPYIKSLGVVFVIGQLCHFVFCVDSTIVKLLKSFLSIGI